MLLAYWVTISAISLVIPVSTLLQLYWLVIVTYYRAMLVQSAVMRLHVVCLSVCLPVCLSVCNV